MTVDLRARALVVAAVYASIAALAGDAGAAPPWVDRHLTLPSGDWAFDAGLGVGHVRTGPDTDDTAAGVNAEMAGGVPSRVQIGVRTGIRFGDGFARLVRADEFGRLFDRQTFAVGGEVLANPE